MEPDEPTPDERERALAKRAERRAKLFGAAKAMRKLLPGDSELGDPLSTAGDDPSQVIARHVSEAGAQEPSVTRELGLGALQVWQAFSEAQGRGHGDQDLAILFTDLVDFSSWALEAGDEAVLELLREMGRAVEPAITARRGRVVKRLGDGLMAVFSDSSAGLESALEACRAVGELEVDGHRPQLRAGLHVGRPRKIGGDYVGVDVNIAARVAAAARGGEVLVSAATRDRLDPEAFKLSRRRFKAKGAPKDLEVYSTEPR
jgi:adenylate cyclase